MNATSDRLSRWTPAMFACALVNLGLAWPVAPAVAVSLAMVHLLTIGWLTLLMFGALFQFVPVITSRKLPSQTLPLATLIFVEGGLALMVGGSATWPLRLGGTSAADRRLARGRGAGRRWRHLARAAHGQTSGAAQRTVCPCRSRVPAAHGPPRAQLRAGPDGASHRPGTGAAARGRRGLPCPGRVRRLVHADRGRRLLRIAADVHVGSL